MSVLNSLILKLLSAEEQTFVNPTEQQEDGELFLDTNLVPAQNIDKEQVGLIL